jgi:hypothetical protein
MEHVKQDVNSLNISMLRSKALKVLACFFSLYALNYDKIACEISIMYDAEKHQLLLLLLYLLTAIGLSPGGRTQSHTNNT